MKKIFVTQPSLPPLEDFVEYLEAIWESKQVTNQGPFHRQLEQELAEYLKVDHLSLFANGTLALITALQAKRISGEVITTPFSFVATSHSLWWNNVKPVFVDIEPDTFNLDPRKVEAAITPKTTAILPVHVYGNPCNIEELQKIADIYGLSIIYDAAHAFGVECDDRSLVSFGDMSVLSFHGTKVFNTFEGGAIICNDDATKKRIDFLKNFGFADDTTVVAPGFNAKMNEFQAALGLLQLKTIDQKIEQRRIIAEKYRNMLSSVPGITVLHDIPNVRHNYSYFPVLVDKTKFGIDRDALYEGLKKCGIFTRRYFYPLISNFPAYRTLPSAEPSNLAVANKISEMILCLPIYPDLDHETADMIVECIASQSIARM